MKGIIAMNDKKKFDAKEFMSDALGWIIGDKEITFDKNNEEEARYRKDQLSWYCEQYARLMMEKNLELCEVSCILRKYIQVISSNKNNTHNILSDLYKSSEDEVSPVFLNEYLVRAIHGMSDDQMFWIFKLFNGDDDMIDITVSSTTHHSIEECSNDEVLCRVVLPDSVILTQKPCTRFPLTDLKKKLIEIKHFNLWEALVYAQTMILMNELMNKIDEKD